MGNEELKALIAVLTAQVELGRESPAFGAWKISYDKKRSAFIFDKCEEGGYCEEKPAVIGKDGTVLDPGGPLFG